MIIQPIIDLAAIFARKGIKNAILSPGSRCAPLTLAFVRHPDIHCRTISDERSAAFVALGMAQQLKKPVVLVCSSGTAALNYAPAIAEAFFQQIPLIVLTADRPPEWIDQWDGQTIRQQAIYGRHIKQSYDFPDHFGHPDITWHAHRIGNEAVNEATGFPAGPVHVNIPIREPFYPESQDEFDFNRPIPIVNKLESATHLSSSALANFKNELARFKRVVIIPGQQASHQHTLDLLNELATQHKVVIISDTISNMQSSNTITFHDQLLPVVDHGAFSPDLIISFGKSIISKPLKNFLRSSGAEHWHIQPAGYSPDTYQGLAKIIPSTAQEILRILVESTLTLDGEFHQRWHQADQAMERALKNTLEKAPFGEWKAIYNVLNHLPETSKLHLANSMAVRYVNFLGARKQEIICNRGTSGIDGSNSTAVGCTFTTKEFVTLITGDMAFFYDRNAFWHNYTTNNLRIILLNNHAGGIFRIINGPNKQPELEEFFETKQSLNAAHLAMDFGFGYLPVKSEEELDAALMDFYHPSVKPKIIEVFSDSAENTAILNTIKSNLRNFMDQ
ncbi:2-succinyl-5-enolpyruvyl-6-hydroxy-3-cyclohexene-1-carboxylic-acid synthase [Echinicola vietnamensis]|uniref:2-succinyl-5-enolpyruvyl-6-hydroxy-3-cyclohexene-1-carboxylate synthase n=1 Tax=Echinicola vietnamensis (strain DSM 17526 / LMG 23754 / KMM 6221) TaxID=926556 RepID=L0FZ78_ECHVK|nr:2-succinyl-5-enolpyruvyl-6-hydroxy-3-cyclohexene-1-carboxylic-acid synthase [Echinicola vietnamensis]AGA78592.1 2-succinyl-5-enolpyruvyl-6-hydroxy-3-cyclohexene-1-carboxylic-acid synthase [Echinicola vietnamensis DSM 17526]